MLGNVDKVCSQVVMLVCTDRKIAASYDRKNWLILHGNVEVALDDMWGISKAIGVKFNDDNSNMFNVLSTERGGSKHATSDSNGKRVVRGREEERFHEGWEVLELCCNVGV